MQQEITQINFTQKELEVIKTIINSTQEVYKEMNDFLFKLWVKIDNAGVKDNFTDIDKSFEKAGNAIEELEYIKAKLKKLSK